MPTRKTKADKVQPSQVLAVRQMVDSNDHPHFLAMIYRVEDMPKEDFSDIGHIKPAPVMFQIVDPKDKLIERDTADTLGKAMDYVEAFGRKRGLTLTRLKG